MNEIGLQQVIPAKGRTSAPERTTGTENEQDVNGKTSSASTEVRQTEQDRPQGLARAEQKEESMDQKVERAVAKLNEYVQNAERKLEFQVDEESGHTIVRVYDKHSEELIRQIPEEEALELAQRLNQDEPLMLFSAQV
ncbi:MAG: flagellar protein FlaG [Reinekea sp.]